MNEITDALTLAWNASSRSGGMNAFLNIAQQHGMLTLEEELQIKARHMEILSAQAMRFTRGRSSSVRVETAQELMESIQFVIAMRLKDFASPREAVAALLSKPLDKLFAEGEALIYRRVQATELFYRAMRERRLQTVNMVYNDTLLGGIEGFFRLYEPRLFANRVHITADYPVCFYPQGMQGIEFIRSYLKNWQLEDEFCRMLPQQNVHTAFGLYAIHGREQLRDMVANLYIIALAAALASEAADMNEALERLQRQLQMRKPLYAYVKRTVNEMRAEIENAACVLRAHREASDEEMKSRSE